MAPPPDPCGSGAWSSSFQLESVADTGLEAIVCTNSRAQAGVSRLHDPREYAENLAGVLGMDPICGARQGKPRKNSDHKYRISHTSGSLNNKFQDQPTFFASIDDSRLIMGFGDE